MLKSRKTKVQSVKEKQEAKEVLSFTDPLQHTHEDGTVHTHEGGDVPHTHETEPEPVRSGPMTKEEWCAKNGIARPGSNSAEIQYAQYLAELA